MGQTKWKERGKEGPGRKEEKKERVKEQKGSRFSPRPVSCPRVQHAAPIEPLSSSLSLFCRRRPRGVALYQKVI
jgi:hypothetical protein